MNNLSGISMYHNIFMINNLPALDLALELLCYYLAVQETIPGRSKYFKYALKRKKMKNVKN
jgi:hypothetical protein